MEYKHIGNGTVCGKNCLVFDMPYYSGISTKEFTFFFDVEGDKINILCIDGVLYGEWFTTIDKKEIEEYISEYTPNIYEILREELKNTCEYKISWFTGNNEWKFSARQGNKIVKIGHTNIVSLELYDCGTVEEYIIKYCM